MIRKTLTILSLIGLLLSVGLWGVSYLTIHYGILNGRLGGKILRGEIVLQYVGFSRPWFGTGNGFWIEGFNGFYTSWKPSVGIANDYFYVILPLWIPTVLFASILWFSFVPLRRRRKRKKLGLCLKCGYDLRASKERCPECGKEFDSELITTADGDCGGC